MTLTVPRLAFRLAAGGEADKCLLNAARSIGVTGALHIARHRSGKPFLLADGKPANFGIGISHARGSIRGYSAVALLEGRDVGVDLESGTVPPTDSSFWQTVASAEDQGLRRQLEGAGFDAGTVLWILKESALKCTSEVMTDPRMLMVERRGSLWRVKSAHAATAPSADVDVLLLSVSGSDNERLIAALSLRADLGDPTLAWFQGFQADFAAHQPGWRMDPV